MSEIVRTEMKRAKAMLEQVEVQADIIKSLSTSEKQDAALTERIGEVGWKLGDTDAAIDALRQKLEVSLK
jgi:hypothetical protein